MIILIYGSSHTGKTKASQQLLEKLKYPYLSIDHLKMGLIRSGQTDLTVEDDAELSEYLWPIVAEMMKTAIENDQNMIIEGAYVPHNFRQSFDLKYQEHIKSTCLVFSSEYITNHYDDIIKHRNIIERRLGNDVISKEELLEDNRYNLEKSIEYNNHYILFDYQYKIRLEDFYE